MESQLERKRAFLEGPWFWAAVLVPLLLTLRFLAGFDGLFGQDSYAYLDQARKLHAWITEGSDPGRFFWPRNYSLLGALWPFGNLSLWMQFLSILGTALTVAATIGLARQAGLKGLWLGPLTVILIGLSPFFMRTSLSVMSDTLAIGMLMTGIWAGQAAIQSEKWRRILLAAFLLGSAVWMRNANGAIALPIMLYWTFRAIKAHKWLLIVGMGLLFMVSAIPELFILPAKHGSAYMNSMQHSSLQDWSILNAFRREFVQADGHLHYKIPNILALTGIVWHLGCFGFGLIGFAFLGWGGRKIQIRFDWPLLAGPICYAILLAGIPFQNTRFLLPLMPFALIWLLAGWIWVLDRFKMRVALLVVLSLLLLNLGLTGFVNKKIVQYSETEKAIAYELGRKVLPHENVFEFGMQSMIDARKVPVTHFTMFDSLIIPPKTGDWVLFNLQGNAEVWKGRWPMKNWDAINAKFELKRVGQWKDGWELYELH